MSRSRVLALISADPKLKELCERIHGRKQAFGEKMMFIQKQVENARDQWKKDDEPDWEALKEHLKGTGALEKFDEKTHHLSFSVDTNAVELVENGSNKHPLAMILGDLFQ